jgi:hypothetical protein
MTAIAFDTLKFAQALRDKAKLTPEQAEGISQAFADATGEQLVTKADLKEELAPLRTDIMVQKWMIGFVLAFQAAIFAKMFLR